MTTSLPSGTVTFLFTDIEGSTRLWERDPEAMRPAMERHDELLRETIDSAGGAVFKTVGDGVCAAFLDPAAAISAAISAQRDLEGHAVGDAGPLRVRMAIHTGIAEARGDDYAGVELNRVARLLSAAHGGQILASGTTLELARDSLPREVEVVEMGSHRLRDVERPISIVQIVHPALPDRFPPIRTLDARTDNLPARVSTFVGRERERERILDRLERGRLVTLTGPGGAGKTRLAIEGVRSRVDAFRDGVWLARLETVAEPSQVVAAVAESLGVSREVDAPGVGPLVRTLAEREALLVLDNCEHVLETCAELVDAMLGACPRMRVLATSREPLGVAGEDVIAVATLPVPGPDEPADPERLERYDGIRLFVDRARSARPDFALSDSNAAAVAEICRRLDGLPLAIELAAGEVATLGAREIASHLDRRFQRLGEGMRTGSERHRTLRAAIEWSHDLLEDRDRRLFRRLGVFAGGWSLEAAASVGIDPDAAGRSDAIPADDVPGCLSRLVRKSLVFRGEDEGEARFGMLESVRDYALRRLEESGERDETVRRLRDWCLAGAQRAERDVYGPGSGTGQAWLEREEPNLRAAVSGSLELGDGEPALVLAQTLYPLWFVWGGPDDRVEGAALLERAIAASEDPSLRSRGLYMISSMLRGIDPEASREAAYACLDEAKRSGVARRIVGGLESVAYIEMEEGRDVRAMLEEAVKLAREVGDDGILAQTTNFAGEAARLAGDRERARAYYAESLELSRRKGDRLKQSFPLGNLAYLELHEGDRERAVELWRESLMCAWETGTLKSVASALEGLAAAAVDDEPSRAARFYGAAERIRQDIRTEMDRADRTIHEERIARVKAVLGEPSFATDWREGRDADLGSVVARELALRGAEDDVRCRRRRGT